MPSLPAPLQRCLDFHCLSAFVALSLGGAASLEACRSRRPACKQHNAPCLQNILHVLMNRE